MHIDTLYISLGKILLDSTNFFNFCEYKENNENTPEDNYAAEAYLFDILKELRDLTFVMNEMHFETRVGRLPSTWGEIGDHVKSGP